ncbi:hypothetical protein GCM10011514_18800 [Emticicia aquatilis]|uniref:DUF3857 domain-containing protein n=1 Tax=Emticicia aquatilis TaxID=1537369 RepID=A0A917DPT8_9BACT|nr:DUF3857 and transglutaminase domain-containing protein [Emticicia aquatilis]GGD54862.1 hypothetical protein GCM10011514_18800 [Emticicia aquatilis]
MKKALLFLVTLSFSSVFAQKYPVSTIPAELKEKAHAVVREHKTSFIVKDIGSAVTKVEGAITILDEKGEQHTTLVIPYNKFTKVNDMEAQLYDETGKKIKSLKRDDIESIGGSSGANNIDDSFVKYASLTHTKYPYTIVFSYEFTTKNMMFYPSWEAIPYNAEATSVEQASFMVSMPNGVQLRYKEQNMLNKVVMGRDGDKFLYSWEVSNLKAIEREPYSPSLSEILPTVYTAPTLFKVDDYEGNIQSWADLAKFYGNLNKDREKLPAELITKIKDLVKNETDETKKIKKVYEYLQANTRYVSIQLGIGGWQSMKSEDVANKGYGDCKALTTFTMGMLRELGIKSYQALVKAGDDANDILTDFPSFQFNHVFLCVPQTKDTLWLECTSQTNAFGYLSDFTSNRHVVLIQENGGKLVKTPTYRPNDNMMVRKGKFVLTEDGNAEAEIETRLSGLQQDSHAGVIHTLGTDEQKKWLTNNMSLSSVEIKQFSLTEKREKIPSVSEKMTLALRNISNKSGTRIFLTPNLLNQARTVPLPNPDRKVDFELSGNYMDVDSISFQIPAGFSSEYLPEPTKIQSKFGTYTTNVQMTGDKILYVRQITLLQGRYPAAAFNEFVDFRKKIVKADKNQIVLVKKT